jgi:hypothetical protein
MSPFFVADLGGQSFVVMDSSAVAGVEGTDESANENDDDDDEAGPAPANDLIEKIRSRYQSIAQSIPAHAWLLTHSPFYGVRRDKTTGEDKIDNAIEAEAVGQALSPNIEMITSGHIHMFEALTFGRSNS